MSAVQEWLNCKNARENFRTYLPVGPGNQFARECIMKKLLRSIWAARFTIRAESHDVPAGEGDEPDEVFSDETVPAAWLKHSSAGDILMMKDRPLAEQDASMTDMTKRLERHVNRKKSDTLAALCDAAWTDLSSLDKANSNIYEHYVVMGDVSSLRRIVTFCLDAFEESQIEEDGKMSVTINQDMVSDLRILITYFIGSPITDFCKSWNACIKKRVFQWYTSRARDAGKAEPEQSLIDTWRRLMTRTPAQKKISVLLEARRHYQRSQGALYVNPVRVHRLVHESLGSEFWAKCCAVLCCVGMRANELFRSIITFEKVAGETEIETEKEKHWIIQHGTSKQHNATQMQIGAVDSQPSEMRSATKPICWNVEADRILELIAEIREEAELLVPEEEGTLADISADRIAALFIPKLSATMHAIFDQEAADSQNKFSAFGTSWARKLYAAAAQVQFPDELSNQTGPAFVSKILMHSPGIPKTSVFYSVISFVEPKDDAEERKKRKSDHEEKPKKSKKKRRHVPPPQPSVRWARTPITVMLSNKAREKVEVQKWSHGKFRSPEERLMYFEEVTAYLTSLGVVPSIANLKAVGVSQKFQRDRKQQKKKIEEIVENECARAVEEKDISDSNAHIAGISEAMDLEGEEPDGSSGEESEIESDSDTEIVVSKQNKKTSSSKQRMYNILASKRGAYYKDDDDEEEEADVDLDGVVEGLLPLPLVRESTSSTQDFSSASDFADFKARSYNRKVADLANSLNAPHSLTRMSEADDGVVKGGSYDCVVFDGDAVYRTPNLLLAQDLSSANELKNLLVAHEKKTDDVTEDESAKRSQYILVPEDADGAPGPREYVGEGRRESSRLKKKAVKFTQ
jgi:hypothetical protein